NSGSFAGQANVQTVLDKGTRGEIKGYRKFHSGNYGIKMKILSGPQTGNTLWVYYNKQNPALKLYTKQPQDWQKADPQYSTSELRISKYAETQRKVAAQTQELAETPAAAKVTPKVAAQKAVQAIAQAQKEVAKAQTPACGQACLNQMPKLQKPFLS